MAVRVEQLLPPNVEAKHHPLGFSFALYEPQSKIYNSEDIRNKLGVHTVRRAAQFESTPYMASHVVKKLFQADVPIDFLGVTTSFPTGENLSELLIDVHDLKVTNHIDVYAACSGYTRTLLHLAEIANKHNIDGWNIGIVAAEKYSPYLEKGTFDAGIFTDGAIGLANLKYGENFRILSAVGRSLNPEANDSLKLPINPSRMVTPFISEPIPASTSGKFEMNGPVVYKNVIDKQKGVPSLIHDVLEIAELTPSDIDYVIPHQGSGKTNNGLQLGLPEFKGKLIEDITDGNLSSGSIPRALVRLQPDKEMVRILNVGFGAGLYGAAVITEHGKLNRPS